MLIIIFSLSAGFSNVSSFIRTKRELIDRQTGERYRTVRRKCRVIRSCDAQSRFDEDADSLNFDFSSSELEPIIAQDTNSNSLTGRKD